MGFSDRQMLSPGKKIGCFLYMVLGTFVVLTGVLGAAMGDCADSADSSCKDNFANFLLFPGSLIIVIVGGIFMLWLFLRNSR